MPVPVVMVMVMVAALAGGMRVLMGALLAVRGSGVDIKLHAFDVGSLLAVEVHVEVAQLEF